MLFALTIRLYSQCPTPAQLNDQIEISEKDNKDARTRIKNLYQFKVRFENCQLLRDSVYAKILHKIGILEYQDNKYLPTENSFLFTAEAVRINTSGIATASPAYATKSFSNLSIIYEATGLNKDAIRYCDSTIQYARRYPVYGPLLHRARELKSQILFKTGDYQGSVDEASLGIRDGLSSGDSMLATRLFNIRAESYQLQGDKNRAMKDALKNIEWIEGVLKTHAKEVRSNPGNFFAYYKELAHAYKVRALSIDASQPTAELNNFISLSNYYYAKTGDSILQSRNFNDVGSYYLNTYQDYTRAKENYIRAMRFSKNSQWILAFGYLNLGATDFPDGNYASAEKNYLKMLSLIGIPAKSILETQQVSRLMAVPYKQLVHVYLNNKTELLLGLFKKTNDARYLKACLSTALVTDSVIQEMRREQSAEQSKLFWRNKTRNFFTNALEACFLAKDHALAFYFMEKSRAVILADKLNELGAASLLPATEVVREELLRKEIANEENILRMMLSSVPGYDSVNAMLIEARHQLDIHIKSLERKYPAYYSYKFSSDVLSFQQFKDYLKSKKTSFVSYFLGDTASYILSVSGADISGADGKMIKVPATAYNKKQLDALVTFFADGALQNRQYDSLIRQSHEFYKRMFEPLNVAKGNLIVCPDGFILPYDALYADQAGKKTLLNDYSFSYVYSANSLLTRFKSKDAGLNFAGFAPVSFKPYLDLADLDPSAEFLDKAASNYPVTKLFTGRKSSRKNFLLNMGSYRIVNVFSHASAGNNDEEPMLFMEDSAIHLSELQYLDQINTQLVILSACQTSSGKNVTGEGIYSLSRGFTAAGIPSVMATIWRADENSVYQISVLFHKYIASGMRKDEALRLAKIDYLKTADNEKSLPYYWANMVIMGNTDSIELIHENYLSWLPGILIILGIAISLFFLRQRSARRIADKQSKVPLKEN